jgi:O-methyltransferase
MLGGRCGRALYRLARDVERRGTPGGLVDCGIWNGGSTLLLALGAPSRPVWAFDSFEGMPEPGPADSELSHQFVGACRGSEEKVHEGFRSYSDPERFHVVRGRFEDTLQGHVESIGPIAMLHVDADWFDAVTLVLETLYPSISPGGYVAVDDYNNWEGARRAVDEFRTRHEIEAPLVGSHYWRV